MFPSIIPASSPPAEKPGAKEVDKQLASDKPEKPKPAESLFSLNPNKEEQK